MALRPIILLLGLSLSCSAVAACSVASLVAPAHTAAAPSGREANVDLSLEGPTVVVVSELPPPILESASDRPAKIPRRGVSAKRGAAAGTLEVPEANAILDSQPQPNGAPTVSSVAFEGLDDDDNPFVLTPPDPQVAVGPNHVFEMVNVTGRIFDKNGGTVQTFGLDTFFGVIPGDDHFDPKIIYDSLSGRWFGSYVSSFDATVGPDEGRLLFAVSQTSDPTGAWNVYFLSSVDVFPDYAGIGVTNDKFTISVNLFDIDDAPIVPGCDNPLVGCGERTIVVQKSDVVAGEPAASVGLSAFPIDPTRFTVRPAHSLSSTNDQYLTTWDLSSFDQLTVIRITGTPDAGNVAEASATNLTTSFHDDPPPSTTAGAGDCIIFTENLGPPPCIESGDFRMLEAVWRDDTLWSAASAACLPPGDITRSCAHLIEVETVGTPSVTQDILAGAFGEYYSWPSIRTDAAGNLYASVTRTTPSIFAEARIVGRLATDPPNTIGGPNLLRAGEVVHTSGRWGDYLGAAVDPSDPSCIWVVGEYAKNTTGADWGTYIAATSYSGGCDGAGPTGVVGDVDCDNQLTSVDAALILQLDAGIVTSLLCQELGDVNGDGIVNAIDAALVLQVVVGLIPGLPV